MNKLEPIHEKAIDMFVAGRKQNEIAQELNVNPRTLRRWSDSELFIKELHTQHAQARKLEQDERAELSRRRVAFQNMIFDQFEALLKDSQTTPYLRAVCLRLGMQDIQAARRLEDAREWREELYQRNRNDRLARESAEREDRAALKRSTEALKSAATFFENIQALRSECAEASAEADKSGHPAAAPHASSQPEAAKFGTEADKSGHTPCGPGVPPGPEQDEGPHSSASKADKSGHPRPIVQPVKPFRYSRPEKKADAASQPM